jgi:hypothetical protein
MVVNSAVNIQNYSSTVIDNGHYRHLEERLYFYQTCVGDHDAQLLVIKNIFYWLFLGVVEKLSFGKVDIYCALSSFNNSSSQYFPDDSYSDNGIRNYQYICILKNKSSSGYDDISNRILKFCGKFHSKPLAYIFNKSLTVGKFLGHLKYSVVHLLPKKGRKFELTSYCIQVFLNYWFIVGLIRIYRFMICLLQNNMVLEKDCLQLMLLINLLKLF